MTVRRHRHRYPRHCAVPPHMLDKIARNGTDDQRSRALSTMSLDTSQRSVRVQNALMLSRQRGTVTPRLFPSLEPRRTIGDAKGEETLPGVTVRTEGAPPVADIAVNEAYDGLGATFDFFLRRLRPELDRRRRYGTARDRPLRRPL